MRIVAGEWRGRPIKAPRDARVRPTADRAREAWMSILQHELDGARVVDLCAGSGALGLEALSRGAAWCDFVDIAESAIRCIRENVTTLGAGDRCRVYRGDVLRYVQDKRQGPWDVAFADPPYNLGIAPRIAAAWLARPFSRILGVEHGAHEALPPGGESRAYGGTRITIYRTEAVGAPD
jgi:16S rRNA (guanine966-N2)-methyltransferase